jgi:WD40 repeat protein
MNKSFLVAILLSTLLGVAAAQKPQLMPPFGHTGQIKSISISPDGKYILSAAGGLDHTVLMWTIKGELIKMLQGQQHDLSTVAFSNDGQHILALEQTSGDLSIWDKQGNLLYKHRFPGISKVVFTSDSNHFIGADDQGDIRLFRLDGKLIKRFDKVKQSSSSILDLCLSRDGQYLAAADVDGKIWVFHIDGSLHSTIDSLHQSPIMTIDFSPDGETLVAGDYNGITILWNWKESKSIYSLPKSESYLQKASFSPDGQFFATIAGIEKEVRIWTREGKLFQQFDGILFGMATIQFTPDSRSILVAGNEPKFYQYDFEGNIMTTYGSASSAVTTVDISHTGKFLATGGHGIHARIWNLTSGEVTAFPNQSDFNAPLAFHPLKDELILGETGDFLLKWDPENGFSRFAKVPPSSVAALTYSPDGTHYFISNFTGGIISYHTGNGNIVRNDQLPSNMATHLQVAPDGKSILIAQNTGIANVSYMAEQKSLLTEDMRYTPVHIRSITDFSEIRPFGNSADVAVLSPDGNYVATNATDGLHLFNSSDGKEIIQISHELKKDNKITCLTFSQNNQSIFAGFESSEIIQFNLAGKIIQKYNGHLNAVRSLAISPDGQYLISGSSDCTSRIFSTTDGRELVTLMSVGSDDWLVITPEGLFDASAGAMDQLYYVSELEIIQLDQLKERYFEPGLLAKLFGKNREEIRAVESFTQLPLYPEVTAAFRADGHHLEVKLIPRTGGIGRLNVFINGKEIMEDANPMRHEKVDIDLSLYHSYYYSDKPNTIALRVYDKNNWLKSPPFELHYMPKEPDQSSVGNTTTLLQKKPTLFGIIIGTSDYSGSTLDLRFADRDASLFYHTLKAVAGNVFDERVSLTLLNTDIHDTLRYDVSNKSNIQKTFQTIAALAKPQDVLVLYFSGHGVTYGQAEKAEFFYLTKDIASDNLSDPDIRSNYTVSASELTTWINSVPALKQVLILDACNAGNIASHLGSGTRELQSSQIRAIDRMKDRTGMFILTGSAGDKVSYEASRYGQGLLTYSLLEGISGLGLTEDKRVDVMTLFQYARDKVPELAKSIGGSQIPVMAFPAGGESFDIGLVDEKVTISIAQEKPVFIRNIFQDDSFGDELELIKAMEERLRAESFGGEKASLIYVDVDEYVNAYSIKGRYEIKANEVVLRCRLFKNKTAIGDERILKGTKNDLSALVDDIIRHVSSLIKNQ